MWLYGTTDCMAEICILDILISMEKLDMGEGLENSTVIPPVSTLIWAWGHPYTQKPRYGVGLVLRHENPTFVISHSSFKCEEKTHIKKFVLLEQPNTQKFSVATPPKNYSFLIVVPTSVHIFLLSFHHI